MLPAKKYTATEFVRILYPIPAQGFCGLLLSVMDVLPRPFAEKISSTTEPPPPTRDYRSVLIEAREGINTTEADLKVLDEVVSPLIRQGHSPAMILMNHLELHISEKTIYNYIEKGYMSVINLDLQRKVKYKLRNCHTFGFNDRGIFEGYTYKDFQELLKQHPDIPVVEMDTAAGCAGSKKCSLPFISATENAC